MPLRSRAMVIHGHGWDDHRWSSMVMVMTMMVMKMESGVKSAIIFTKKYEMNDFYLSLKLNQYLYTLSWIQLL